MTPRVIIYARVSTAQQSHDSQLGSLREYCRRRGWPEPEVITDTISGSKFSRTGLDRLMGLVRAGKVNVVLSYKLDRLGRSLAHLVQIIHELQTHGVALVIPDQGIDTSSSNPASALQLNILGAIAQFEREITRERVLEGIKAAKARGVRMGRENITRKHLPAIRLLRDQGMAAKDIAAELGLGWSTVRKILARMSLDEA